MEDNRCVTVPGLSKGNLLPPIHVFDHDQCRFAYNLNRGADDTAVITLQFVVSSLEKPSAYVRMLFVNYIVAVKVV